MRVLCIGTDYPPAAVGGYELQCHTTVRHLIDAGHRVRVLTAARPAPAEELHADVHRRLRRFPTVPRRVGTARAWADERHNARVVAHHLNAFRPDVVSLWRLGELSMSLPGRVARAGVPIVGVVCDRWMVEGPARDPWARRSGGGAALPAGRWVCASRWLRDALRADGVHLGSMPVVTPGVDLRALAPRPAPPWDGRLLYAGRLSPLKGVDTAVAALAELPASVTLDLAGAGSPDQVRRLRDLARRLGVHGRMRLRGPVAPREMPAVYAAADAVLFPVSWEEPWGLVPLEAMAVGRPVVATGTGGSGEYLRDGRNALLVPPGEPGAVAQAVRRLAGDAALRARLVAGGRRTAVAHDAEASCARLRALLEAAAAADVRAAPAL